MQKLKQPGSKSISEYGDLLTVQNAGEVLGLCDRVIRAYCADGTIPAVKIGKRWYIPKARFIEFLNA